MSDKRNILDLAQQTKALAEKATPGPWEWGAGSEIFIKNASGVCVMIGELNGGNDARFTSEARTAAPQLADAVVELSGQLSSLREQVAALQDENDALRECVRYVALGPNSEQAARCRELLAKLGATGASAASDMSEANTEGK